MLFTPVRLPVSRGSEGEHEKGEGTIRHTPTITIKCTVLTMIVNQFCVNTSSAEYSIPHGLRMEPRTRLFSELTG
jgi:hypothetical protein